MKLTLLLVAGCIVTSAALAQDLTWTELARRPEVWPAQCTVKRPMKFQKGSVSAGQKVEVLEVQPSRIDLVTPAGFAFAAKPEDTDALALASETWSHLTPQQRELTFTTLLQRKELWPYRVKLLKEADLGNVKIPRGTSVIFQGVEGDHLLVVAEKENTLFDVAPRDTDLMGHAWKVLGDPGAAPSRLAEELKDKLVDATTGSAIQLDDTPPRYYAFYRGASWCGPCRQFSPSLVKFYNRVKPAHPELALILVSDDKNPADMYKYAKEEGFTCPAVPAIRYANLKLINPLFGQTIPQLVVTDPYGNVLIDSDRVGRETALKILESMLAKPVQLATKKS